MMVEVWKMTLGISLGFNHQVTGEADWQDSISSLSVVGMSRGLAATMAAMRWN